MSYADLRVDYHGTGIMQSAFHPYAKVASIFGRVEMPVINLNNDFEYSWDFDLPYPVINPFLQVIGLSNVDYSFSPRNEAAGQWRITMVGKVVRLKQKASPREEYLTRYTNPVTRGAFDSYIVFGGFRG